ncbi:hypothetical protein C8F01DRAFT_1143138 [Mycena amicta]|nr:hypothetical protein C8F01DRAFT_1143138 [Mycena amicta]
MILDLTRYREHASLLVLAKNILRTNRCLCIVEILDVFVQMDDHWHWTSASYRRHHHNLALLARTCKMELNGSFPLFRLLPPDVKAFGQRRTVQLLSVRPLQPEDWKVALNYTSRVRRLHIVVRESDELKAIAESFPVWPVFPRLQALDWRHITPLYWHSFMSPTLTKLSITISPSLTDWNLADVHVVAAKLPELHILELDLPWEDSLHNPLCAILTAHLFRLRTFSSNTIDQTTLAQVITLSTIDMTVDRLLPGRDKVQGWSSTNTFTTQPSLTLHTLRLVETTMDILAGLLECAPVWALRELTMGVDVLETHGGTRRFYATLASRLQADRLETLFIEKVEDGEVVAPGRELMDDYVVDGRTLQLLFCFPNLSSVALNASAGYDLDDETLEHLTYAWPRITTLAICSKTEVQIKPRATARALLAFARNCKFLRRLTLPLDMSPAHVPSFESYRDARPTQSTLTLFNVCTSPIENPMQVAQFLSGLFPALVFLHVAVEWNWISELDEEDPLFEGFEEERAWYMNWDEVARMVSYFAAARAEEQYCSNLLVPNSQTRVERTV